MLAIYKRELKSYFHSFIGLLFIGVMLFFVGLYYTAYNLSGYPYFSYAISGVIFVFLLAIPILSMRILAEERKNKTDQLILTAPVTVGQIVMGKFLALLTIFAIPTLIICAYPLILCQFGSVPLGEAYLAILAFFLYGMASIAIGLFASSLTESQVIAAVLGFGFLFLGYMMSAICSLISTTGNLLTKILSVYDMYTPFVNLLNGTLDLSSVVYFVTLTALVLFLTVQSVQKRRYSVSVKQFSVGAYSTGMIAVAVVIAILVNIVVGELPGSITNIDMTSQKLYSLTDQTKEFVKGMEEDVTIYVLIKEENCDTTLAQTLQRYEDLSDHISVEFVDPTVNPRFHTQYTSASISTNSLIVVSDKRSKVIDSSVIYESGFDYYSYSYTTTGYDGEGQITSALDYVTSDSLPKVYMLEGHGEATLSSTFTDALTKENVEYETICLMNYDEVPEDTACLVINAPSSDFSEDDKNKVIDYLEAGGKVIVNTVYTGEDMPNFYGIMEYMGIAVEDGLVLESNSSYYYQIPFYLLPEVKTNSYTTNIVNNYYIFAPYAQGMLLDEEDESLSFVEILTTSEHAYVKSSVSNASDYSKSEGDVEGTFVLGVEAVKTYDDAETEATLVAYSCSELFTDSASQVVSGANLMLFTNTVSKFVDHEVSVSIPVKEYEVSTLTLPQSSKMLISAITTVIMPLACLAIGFVIWFKRRRR